MAERPRRIRLPGEPIDQKIRNGRRPPTTHFALRCRGRRRPIPRRGGFGTRGDDYAPERDVGPRLLYKIA